YVESNNFVFDDIEPILNSLKETVFFRYKPQEYIDESATVSVNFKEVFLIKVEETNSPNNTYQWRKNGVNIEGATNHTYTISSVSGFDSGEYDCLINNTVITDLTLNKNIITLNVVI